MKYTKYIFAILCVGLYLFDYNNQFSYGFYSRCDIINRFMYMFAHSNIIHLAINVYAATVFLKLFERETILSPLFWTIIGVLWGFIASLFSNCYMPTIGLSGVCFFYIGVRTSYMYDELWFYSLIGIVAFQIIAPFFININVQIHCISLIAGIGYGYLLQYFYKIIRYEKKTINTNRRRDDAKRIRVHR